MTAVHCNAACRCGKPLKVFVSSGRVAKACSEACARKTYPRYQGKPQRPKHTCTDCGAAAWKKAGRCNACYTIVRKRKGKECNGCGKVFVPKSRNSTFCSRKCARNYNSKRPRESKAPGPYRNIWFRSCVVCGAAFVARHKSTLKCHAGCKPARPERACKWCGDKYRPMSTGGRPGRFCGDACRRAAKMESRRRRRKLFGNNYRHRARKAGVAYETINRRKVFERDGWRCQICGKATPPERQGKRYSNSPELDHRVPFALGGPHLYSNVQCACRACNGWKAGHTAVGQHALFNQ